MAPDPVSNEVLLERLESLQRTMNRIGDKLDKMNGRVRGNEVAIGKLQTETENLERKSQGWDVINTVGVLVASILGAFGIRQ